MLIDINIIVIEIIDGGCEKKFKMFVLLGLIYYGLVCVWGV